MGMILQSTKSKYIRRVMRIFIFRILGTFLLGFCAGYICFWIRNKILDLGFRRKENLCFAIVSALFAMVYAIYLECK